MDDDFLNKLPFTKKGIEFINERIKKKVFELDLFKGPLDSAFNYIHHIALPNCEDLFNLKLLQVYEYWRVEKEKYKKDNKIYI